jgi:hypothetical protein
MKLYQMKRGNERLMFVDHGAITEETGDARLDRKMYEAVWEEPDGDQDVDLEEIFERFNVRKPEGFKGRSMSVGDLVEIGGKLWFCAVFGFEAVEWRPEEPRIKAVRIVPGKPAEPVTVQNTLEGLQAEVDGYIECTYPFEDNVVVIGNEEAKLIGMEGNRRINGAIYAGPLVIVGDDGYGENIDLTDEQIRRYVEMFKEPEEISPAEVERDTGFVFIPF